MKPICLGRTYLLLMPQMSPDARLKAIHCKSNTREKCMWKRNKEYVSKKCSNYDNFKVKDVSFQLHCACPSLWTLRSSPWRGSSATSTASATDTSTTASSSSCPWPPSSWPSTSSWRTASGTSPARTDSCRGKLKCFPIDAAKPLELSNGLAFLVQLE